MKILIARPRPLLAAIALALASTAILPTSALAYGKKGHQTVGAIADQLLKGTNAEKRVKAILGAETLSHASTWPDEVKHGPFTAETKAYAKRNPHHGTNHYSDIPIQKKSYSAGSVGAGPEDVVATINRCIKVLQSGQDDPTITQKEALKVLVHLVGDIHQPLHVGSVYLDKQGNAVLPKNEAEAKATGTIGGNDIDFHGNLHSFWDETTVEHAMSKAGVSPSNKNAVNLFAAKLAAKEPAGWSTGGLLSKQSARWATEMMPLAAEAHHDLTIGAQQTKIVKNKPVKFWPATAKDAAAYNTWSTNVTSQNLQRAGWRLAGLLEKIWP